LKLKAQFQRVINPSEGGAKLTNVITEQIEIAMRSHPGPNQVYVIMFGGNNMHKTTRPALEIAKLVSRFRRIMTEAQKANVRVLLCGDIPDPRPAVDSRLKLLDEALKDLEMGEGNRFIALRSSLLDAQGAVRTDIFKPRGDIHLNASGTQIVSLRIQQMLQIMLPNPVPVQAPVPDPGSVPVQTPALVQTPAKVQRPRVQAPVPDPAPVVVNTPPVVGAPLVAVANAPAVVQAPAGALVAVVETPMEVEDEDAMLERLFFKKYGRALPEPEKEKEKDVDINFVIDLTDEDEMEVATSESVPAVAVVKTEPIEVVNVANVNNVNDGRRHSSRLERLELAKARKAITEFGKSLRKSETIPEKEAPAENVIADTDTDMAEDTSVGSVNAVESVNSVESDNTVEPLTAAEAFEMAEQAIAESDAAIAANQKVIDDFYN
jgi:lysophospholipase L1-like esterase